MALLAPDEGEVILLERLLNKSAADDPVVHLYVNNITPAESDTISTYTEAAGGYAAITATGTNWTVTPTIGDVKGVHPNVTFSFTTSQDVYGYYITNTAGTKVLWSERFTGAPFSMPVGGGTITITPEVGLD